MNWLVSKISQARLIKWDDVVPQITLGTHQDRSATQLTNEHSALNCVSFEILVMTDVPELRNARGWNPKYSL